MELSETIKLYMTKNQKLLIAGTMDEYINTVNSLVSVAMSKAPISKYTTADFEAELPAALKNQCIRDAKSIIKKYYKKCHKAVLKNRSLEKRGSEIRTRAPRLSALKRPCCYINNQNFKIKNDCIEFPVLVNGNSTRLSVKTKITDKQKEVLSNNKLGTMRIVIKNHSIVAQVVYSTEEPTCFFEGAVMGVDLGIKCPAVSYISDGSVKFYGNGRKNKYMRRHYKYLRKRLQCSKHPSAVKRISDKEQRIMKDTDHKISHDIVETAVTHNVKVIKMEQLANIRSTTRTSRKNDLSLHTWSFYRLAKFIEYKAMRAGIKVEYVNPAYTSQVCPVCGHVHHADDRNYVCDCGYHSHRDLVGAINICNSTEYVGDSNIRRTA